METRCFYDAENMFHCAISKNNCSNHSVMVKLVTMVLVLAGQPVQNCISAIYHYLHVCSFPLKLETLYSFFSQCIYLRSLFTIIWAGNFSRITMSHINSDSFVISVFINLSQDHDGTKPI